MFKIINRNIAFQWIMLFGLLAFSIYKIVTQTQVANEQGTPFLFINFTHLFFQHEFIGKGIIIIVLLLQILFIQYYFNKNDYAVKYSLLPTCFYLSILLLSKSLTIISPFFFTLLFLLIIISIDYTVSAIKIKNNVFWTGILIAFATCFDLSSIILLLLIMVTLIINQFSRIKEIGILLFGFFLFYFYVFSFHFFINNLNEWLLTFQQIKIMSVLNSNIDRLPFTIFSLISLIFVYLFFMIKFKLMSETKVAIQRNRIITLNTRAFLIIACIFLSNSGYPFVLGYLFVHISIYLAMLAQEKNIISINELITIITLIALWH